MVTNRLDAATLQFLADGGKVLLFPPTNELKHSVGGAFHDRLLVLAHVCQGRDRAKTRAGAGHAGLHLRSEAIPRWRSFRRSSTATGNGGRSSKTRGRSSLMKLRRITARSST